jgi:hypothetical protein
LVGKQPEKYMRRNIVMSIRRELRRTMTNR